MKDALLRTASLFLLFHALEPYVTVVNRGRVSLCFQSDNTLLVCLFIKGL